MKKTALLLGACIIFFMGGLFGVEIGDEAPPLEIRDWVFGGLVDFAVPKEQQKTSQKLTVVVCWGTWLTDVRDVTPLLEQLQKEYRSKELRVIMVTTEPKETVDKFFADKKHFNCFVGLDKDEKSTRAYMGASRLFPKAFLINQAGQLIWNGEVFDLGSIVKLYYEKKFTVNDWKKLGKLYGELEILLRSRFDENIVKITDQILALNQDDGFAIRARLFYYDTVRQNDKAIEFLEQLAAKSPGNTGIYLAAFSILSSQFPQNEEKTLKFAGDYVRHLGKDTMALQQLAMILLRDFGYMNGSLELTSRIVPTLLSGASSRSGAERGTILSTAALYSYKIGDLKTAVSRQTEAVPLMAADQKVAAQKLLEFYKSALRLNEAG